MIPIFEPYLRGNEKKYLLDCIEKNWISSQGKYIQLLEQALAEYHNVEHAIVTSNCTSALHLSLKVLNIGYGDEVICPTLTFIAPANMIVLSGAKLVLVDIDPNTLTIDPSLIEEKITQNTKAIIVVHQFGHAAHMDEIMILAKKYDLKVIEDNAESIGGRYKGQMLGTFGDVSTLSFFGNKIITSGEGGAVLTNDKNVADRCRILRDHGMSANKKYHPVDLGFNYRMTNMQAAIGLAQIERLDKILNIRLNQMHSYYKLLKNITGISTRSFANWCTPVHWMMTIILEEEYHRDELIQYMAAENIECRPMINPCHCAEHLKLLFEFEKFPKAEMISKNSIHLPSGSNIDEKSLEYIVSKVKKYLRA